MVDSQDITLEKIKTQELFLEINTLSNLFQQNNTPPEPPQIQEVDPNNESKPQFKKYCSFFHKNNHSVSTCFCRFNMLKESKPQSKSPMSSLYKHFETPSNKRYPQYSRYRSRSNSISYRRSSSDSRYKSGSHSRSNYRPRYNDKSYYHNHPSYYDRNCSRYDKHSNQSPSKSSYSSSLPYYNSTSFVVHPNTILVLVNTLLVIITPLLNDITFPTVLLLNLVIIATVVDCTQTKEITLIF